MVVCHWCGAVGFLPLSSPAVSGDVPGDSALGLKPTVTSTTTNSPTEAGQWAEAHDQDLADPFQAPYSLSSKAACGRQLSHPGAHGSCDVVAVGRQADDEAQRRNDDAPNGRVDLAGQNTILDGEPNSGKGTGHVAHLAGAVGEDNTDSGEDLSCVAMVARFGMLMVPYV